MLRRCDNSKYHDNYGEHGTTVCAEWLHDYPAFLAYVGRAPSPQHTLDRWPNPAGNYEPGNVRWATPKEQRANQRPRRYRAARYKIATCLILALLAIKVDAASAKTPCRSGKLWRVHVDKCVSLSSPAALAYAPLPRPQRIKIVLPDEIEPPLKPADIDLTVPDVDPDITDIPLTDPDPATMALKQQLEKPGNDRAPN
jgi:hypothetical protein